YIKYEDVSVSGLQIGGPVKYYGIDIGRVEDIKIDRENVANIIVVISVKSGTPLKEDVKASLIPIGITGLLQVEITGGSNEAGFIKPKTYIPAGVSTFDSISGKAEILTKKMEILLNNLGEITNKENQRKLNNILSNVDSIITKNRQPASDIVSNLERSTTELADITRELNTILQTGKVQNVITNVEKISDEIAEADVGTLLNNLDETIKKMNVTLAHIDATHMESRQDIIDTIENLKETLEYLNEFSRQISEDPSLLLRAKKRE
ncbi:MAG: MlaD family protein, partial [Candidatus Cloacimonetes bacterium]|nr:MlaD family protein [Candidatus Cloacimonadota bacterium]